MSLIIRRWLKLWNGKPPRLMLLLINIMAALIMAIPVLYVFVRAVFAPLEKWQVLLGTRIPMLLWNTISLAGSVALVTTIIGVCLAWLVEQTNLPGRRILKGAFILPLAIPPYIGALTYIIVFGKRGVVYSLLGSSIIDIYSFFPVAFILSMFTFPYVFLIVSAALSKINGNYEEAGRSSGADYTTIFRRVILPLIIPAILSGNMIVFFYIISDFGAVSMLRYSTFTSSVYFQMVGKLDRSGAAILSMLTIVIGVAVLFAKAQFQKYNAYFQNPKSNRINRPLDLGKSRNLCLIFVLIVLFFSVIMPLTALITWSIKGIYENAVTFKMLGYISNSLFISIGAAFITMLISIPITYFKFRYPSRLTSLLNGICNLGLIIPGTLIALGMVFAINRYFVWLIGGPIVLIIGHAMRYLPRSLQSTESSMALISPILDETAYSLGMGFGTVLRKVILPTILPGVFSGGILVMVSSLKELPITLMLRPPGYDTLAVRIWIQASDGFYTHAAPAGLLIVIASLIPLFFLVGKDS
jgi:iron(III) transport system permease protein